MLSRVLYHCLLVVVRDQEVMISPTYDTSSFGHSNNCSQASSDGLPIKVIKISDLNGIKEVKPVGIVGKVSVELRGPC